MDAAPEDQQQDLFSSARTMLAVRLARRQYSTGDTVRAAVCLNVADDAKGGLDLKGGIQVVLHGYEAARWKTDRAGRDVAPRVHTFLFGRLVLPRSEAQFKRGQFQWNVTFTLPSPAPSSFAEDLWPAAPYRQVWPACGQVAYVLYAEGLPSAQHPTLRAWQAIPVAATPRLKPPAPVERQQATSAADCCVGGGGRVTARVAVDRAWCKRGGAVAVTLEVDNASSAAVRGVRLALTQAMDIEPAKHDDCFFGTGRGIRRLVEHALPGVPPRTRAKGAAAMRATLELPADLQPSYSGVNVTLQYAVEATLRMGWWAPDVCIRVPLIVVATCSAEENGSRLQRKSGATAAAEPPIQLPAFWQPGKDAVQGPFPIPLSPVALMQPHQLAALRAYLA